MSFTVLFFLLNFNKTNFWVKLFCNSFAFFDLQLDWAFNLKALKLTSVFAIKISFSKKINTNLMHLKYEYSDGRSYVTNRSFY